MLLTVVGQLGNNGGAMNQWLVIRTDVSTQMGTGHLMRCLALAQAWLDADGQVMFVLATESSVMETRLVAEGIQVVHLSTTHGSPEDARNTTDLAQQMQASWVVVDGYHFGAEYQKILKKAGLSLLFVDDYGHAEHYYADIVLNQNIDADEVLYVKREPYTRLLLGTRYALLRREFWQWRGWKRKTPSVAQKILVTLGGADPDNATLKVLRGLQLLEMNHWEAVVVVGGSNPYYECLQAAVRESKCPICLKRNVTNMPELMAWADVAISAGGSTSWELAFMGLPSIVMILADNQRAIAEKLGDMGLAINLGWHRDIKVEHLAGVIGHLMVSSDARTEMLQRGSNLVDGEGGFRVARVLVRGR